MSYCPNNNPMEAVARLSDTGPDRVKVKLLTLFHTAEPLSLDDPLAAIVQLRNTK